MKAAETIEEQARAYAENIFKDIPCKAIYSLTLDCETAVNVYSAIYIEGAMASRRQAVIPDNYERRFIQYADENCFETVSPVDPNGPLVRRDYGSDDDFDDRPAIEFVEAKALLDARESQQHLRDENSELRQELNLTKIDFERAESELMFNQKYVQHGDDVTEKIMSAARTSHRRATMCAKGQTITASDFLENHVIWAAMAYVKSQLQSETQRGKDER